MVDETVNSVEEVTSEQTRAIAPQNTQTVSMWSDTKSMNAAWRTANMLAKSDLLPETYRNRPENVLIAVDLAVRLNLSPMLIAQQLYIVKGKPAWSGQFCISLINGCGRFTPLEFVFVDEGGGGCFCQAVRKSDGKLLRSVTVTMQMAQDEGWLNKSGSKWKTMPSLMQQYRAASFFARVYCPDILMGVQTADEVRDVNGYEENEKPVITVSL